MQGTSVENARAIMGKNFFGVEDAVRIFGLTPTKEQLRTLEKGVPFSEGLLDQCGYGYVLAAVFPLSIIEIGQSKTVSSIRGIFSTRGLDSEPFAHDKSPLGWYLVSKAPVTRLETKSWSEQMESLSAHERVSPAHLIIYVALGHGMASGGRHMLFSSTVRTSCKRLNGERISVYGGKTFWHGVNIDSRRRDKEKFISLGMTPVISPDLVF